MLRGSEDNFVDQEHVHFVMALVAGHGLDQKHQIYDSVMDLGSCFVNDVYQKNVTLGSDGFQRNLLDPNYTQILFENYDSEMDLCSCFVNVMRVMQPYLP